VVLVVLVVLESIAFLAINGTVNKNI